jgi:hypothetical protein
VDRPSRSASTTSFSNRVPVGIAPFRREAAASGAELVVEDAVAHLLRGGDFGLVARKPNLKRADPAENGGPDV